MVIGRLATTAARLLAGKHKPSYTTFLDTGDHVIIVNAAKVAFTGRKLEGKLYRRHSPQQLPSWGWFGTRPED